ncbi:MAG: hypothetical protein LUD02_01305 [Tannerellaceae bacterium]|nr:hypothetical protein [Tannerellaceae bacterium]MCD8262941.1 hypothetical protein [Tannerellaceae bacterium]
MLKSHIDQANDIVRKLIELDIDTYSEFINNTLNEYKIFTVEDVNSFTKLVTMLIMDNSNRIDIGYEINRDNSGQPVSINFHYSNPPEAEDGIENEAETQSGYKSLFGNVNKDAHAYGKKAIEIINENKSVYRHAKIIKPILTALIAIKNIQHQEGFTPATEEVSDKAIEKLKNIWANKTEYLTSLVQYSLLRTPEKQRQLFINLINCEVCYHFGKSFMNAEYLLYENYSQKLRDIEKN